MRCCCFRGSGISCGLTICANRCCCGLIQTDRQRATKRKPRDLLQVHRIFRPRRKHRPSPPLHHLDAPRCRNPSPTHPINAGTSWAIICRSGAAFLTPLDSETLARSRGHLRPLADPFPLFVSFHFLVSTLKTDRPSGYVWIPWCRLQRWWIRPSTATAIRQLLPVRPAVYKTL